MPPPLQQQVVAAGRQRPRWAPPTAGNAVVRAGWLALSGVTLDLYTACMRTQFQVPRTVPILSPLSGGQRRR